MDVFGKGRELFTNKIIGLLRLDMLSKDIGEKKEALKKFSALDFIGSVM